MTLVQEPVKGEAGAKAGVPASNGTGRHTEPPASEFKPLRLLDVEIGDPLPAIEPCEAEPGHVYERALALVRLHTRPLGLIHLPLEQGSLSAEQYAYAIWQSLSEEIRAHQREDGLPVPDALPASGLPSAETPACVRAREAVLANAPFVSIVVATHDRPATLATCVSSLLALEYPQFEIIVIDNAPSSNSTVDFIRETYGDEPRVRYVREDRPGLSWARNRGVQEVQGEIVAFTDDDAVVDRNWLAELVTGFRVAENVGCVTGATFPVELQTQAQLWFEIYGCFSNGYTRRVFDMGEHRLKNGIYPYSAGIFGAGVNMALRTAVVRAIGSFDPALGAGTPARGGEDLAMFFQIISAGYTLVYEPGAIVSHLHRREYAALRKQMYGYGVGWAAYLTKCMIDRPTRLLDVPTWIPTAVSFLFSAGSKNNAWRPSDLPKELKTIERKGLLRGPFIYSYSRLKLRFSRGRSDLPKSVVLQNGATLPRIGRWKRS
jgi:glycosyltransferase involved in cell wall biosynthesis